MYAAAEIYQDFNHWHPPRVEQYGLHFVSESADECREYIKANYNRFLEPHGHCYPAILKFNPAMCPRTMGYLKTSPSLHIAYYKEAEYLASGIIEKPKRN